MMKNKKIIVTFFSTFIFVVISFFGIMFVFDPLQLFHKHWTHQEKLVGNIRQQAAGIINQYEFDSIILGTSMLENTSSREASKELGGKFVNISISAGDYHERSFLLGYALKQKHIKKVLYSLDYIVDLTARKKRVDTFDYLYDHIKLNDFRAYTNVKYLKCLINNKKCFDDNIDFDRPNAWYKEENYSNRFGGLDNWFKAKNSSEIRKAFKNISEIAKKVHNKNSIHAKQIDIELNKSKKYVDDYILSFVKTYPDTEFILVLPPHSRLRYAMLAQYDMDKFSIYKAMMKYLVSKSNAYSNLKIFGWGNYSFVDDIANYKDPRHYEYTINSWMLSTIARDEGLLTDSNIDTYLDLFTKKALEFDLIGFGKKIDIYLENN
jgi:hypothetical protein